jgi:signal recognition particle subunit SRP54
MVFANLSSRLQKILGSLKGKGRLTEADVKEALREIKLALLEADVNFKVVRDFVSRLQEKCVGVEVLSSLTPGQNVIRIVRDELTELLGSTGGKLSVSTTGKTVYMLVGLQGMGKTTTAAKLARMLKEQGKRPALVSLDTYRPAAIEQLRILAQETGNGWLDPGGSQPLERAKTAYSQLLKSEYDPLIFDTAGRLHIDESMMDELVEVRKVIRPTEIILVMDAMAGQDAVNVAKGFSDRHLVDSVVLTKLDSDTRGGAALSVKAVTGKPIKFIGMGEKTDQLEVFHPDRMSSQILGMGDVLTLIEKAEQVFDQEQALKLQEKLRKQQFNLDDYRDQIRQLGKMGSLEQIASMLPGGAKLGSLQYDEKEMKRFDAIISSMTPDERRRPEIINGSRRKRIALGSGSSVQQVNRLLRQFEMMQKLFKQFDPKTAKKGKLPFPFKF